MTPFCCWQGAVGSVKSNSVPHQIADLEMAKGLYITPICYIVVSIFFSIIPYITPIL